MSECCEQSTTNLLILMVVDIVVSFFGFIAAMRWRAKCGDNFCSCKPKDSLPSPGSDMNAPSPPERLPKGAVAVVIDTTREDDHHHHR